MIFQKVQTFTAILSFFQDKNMIYLH